jgi:acyl-CoA synthetase (AMP-forming)/AMP-acid ligase II
MGLAGALARLARSPAGEVGDGVGAAAFVARAAAWRAAFAAQPGRRWALHLETPVEFAAALFGAWHAGKQVTLPGELSTETLAALRQQVDGFAGELPDAITIDAPPSQAPQAPPSDWPDLPLDHTEVVLFTSGSTGTPAAIVKRLRQLDAECAALQQAFGTRLPAGVRVMTTVSHQHIYGLLFCVLWPLAAGRTIAARRSPFLEDIAQACGEAPLVLIGSPAHLERIPAGLPWSGARTALRAVFCSGGPLRAGAAADALRLLGQAPIEVYGSSETGGIAWRQGGTASWTPLPGVAWRLQDGCLAVRSAHVGDVADDGWFVCPDLAHADGSGGFVLAGRADRIVKIEGKRVSLARIEQRLLASPLVRDARVLPLHTDIGERIAAVVVLSGKGTTLLDASGRRALIAALRGELAESVEAIALPRRWRFPATLPSNPQGKTPESMLRALFQRVLPDVRWQQRDAARVTAILHIGEDLAVFDGHFPQTPIVPGVAQVDWALALAEEALDIPPRASFCRLDTLKFQRVLRPGDEAELELDWQPERLSLAFLLKSAAGTHSSGRIVFGKQDV